jgi:CBS domain-containing protein
LLRWSGLALTVSLVGGSLLTVDADTTGFGARGAMEYPRTWLDFMAATAFCLVLLGVLVGRAVVRARAGALALAAGVASLAVVAVGADQYSRVSEMDRTAQQRASAWDAQDRSIRAQAAAGVRELVYHPLPIGDLAEPFSDTGRATFARGCAETYFGVPRLLPPAQHGK